MIVLDSSALLAVLFEEATADQIRHTVAHADQIIMSPANALECVLRLAPQRGVDQSEKLDAFLSRNDITIVPIDLEQLALARAGFIAYGKGRHPAGLNFGDCFAYALAKSRNAPLLFVGGDFAKTDVKAALI